MHGFLQRSRPTGALDAYKQLKSKDLNWDKAVEVVTGAENLPTLMLTLPPPAKRQREDGHREGGGSKAEALCRTDRLSNLDYFST